MANNNVKGKGTDKVLQRLKESVENANYYEAHQMYRTVCRRYIKQKKYDSAVELLFSGAQTLLKHQQGGSGTDLAVYMIETYNEEQLHVTDESRSRIIQLLELFSPNEIGRKKFIDAAVSWSVKFGENPAGDPELHHYVGELFWKNKNYSEAEPHFLAGTSESSKSYGKMLAEWSDKDQFERSGLYIARAVLQYLCLRNIKDAKISFDTFISEISSKQQPKDIKTGVSQYRPTITGDSIEIPIYSPPLLNFLQLLILTVQRDAGDLFISLRNKYKNVLSVDQSDDLLNRIGDVFFNIKQQRPPQFNILQDLMSNLFQGPMMGGGGGGSGGSGGRSSSSSQSNSHSRLNSSSELD